MLGWNRQCWDEVRAVDRRDVQQTETVLLQLLVGGMLRTRAIHLKPLVYTPETGRGRQQGSLPLVIQER